MNEEANGEHITLAEKKKIEELVAIFTSLHLPPSQTGQATIGIMG